MAALFNPIVESLQARHNDLLDQPNLHPEITSQPEIHDPDNDLVPRSVQEYLHTIRPDLTSRYPHGIPVSVLESDPQFGYQCGMDAIREEHG